MLDNFDCLHINHRKTSRKYIKSVYQLFGGTVSNFKFGNKRKGDVSLLKKFGKKYDYRLSKISPFKYHGNVISSTRIRKFLQRGKIETANKQLSRSWFIEGHVTKGKKLGRKLGYRTCNIHIKNYVLPKTGIYVVKVTIENKKGLNK